MPEAIQNLSITIKIQDIMRLQDCTDIELHNRLSELYKERDKVLSTRYTKFDMEPLQREIKDIRKELNNRQQSNAIRNQLSLFE